MAVKASASITLSSVVDVKATYRYYLLQSSTLAKPAAPNVYPPVADVQQPLFTNLVPTATDNDGSVYNSVGYKDDYRWSASSVAIVESNSARITGWMPFTPSAICRIQGFNPYKFSSGGYVANGFYMVGRTSTGTISTVTYAPNGSKPYEYDEANDIMTCTLPASAYTYFRISGYKGNTDPIVTCNEEIAYGAAPGWSDTEPSYTEGSTNSLYFVDCTVFCDDTWQYSPVSLSSSYEAAKAAYNKAVNAQNTADAAQKAVDDAAVELHETITTQSTSIIKDCENIILEATKNYTETGDFESYKETVDAQLKLLSDQMTLQFQDVITSLQNVNGDLQEQINAITIHFAFDVNGMTIGREESPYKVIIDDDRYSMTANNVEVLWIDVTTGEVYTPEMVVTRKATTLGYASEMDDLGRVNERYVGGE